MKDQKLVLLIEDIEGSRRTYTQIISLAGYFVDAVSTLDEAIDKIKRRTYHVAVVDITLDVEDIYNRDGLKIIQYLSELGEGTEAIILSAQEAVEVAVEAFQKFGLVQYLEKRKLKRPADLSSAVDKAFERCKIKELSHFESITAFLSGQKDSSFWEYKCLSVLKPASGMFGLNNFLNEFCKPFTPLLPRKGAESPTTINEDNRCMSGEFWSRGIGQAIQLLAMSNKSGNDVLKIENSGHISEENILRRYEHARVLGLALASPHLSREEFVDKL